MFSRSASFIQLKAQEGDGMRTKVIYIVILVGILSAIVFTERINEADRDEPTTQLYTGDICEQAYSAQGKLRSCPKIMMATVYRVPLGSAEDTKLRVQPSLIAYDKYGTEVISAEYGRPQTTYSYKLDDDGNLCEVVWHDFTLGPDSEYGKTVLHHYPDSKQVDVTWWHGPIDSSEGITYIWKYELDDNGRAIKRITTQKGREGEEGTVFVYKRDENGNITHELEYAGERLFWDKWHTYDSDGHEMTSGINDMVCIGTSKADQILAQEFYENKAFDECGNWTCRQVHCQSVGPTSEVIFYSYMEYRSLLYYPE